MQVIITGASWFIGFHVAQALLVQWYHVIGVDNENDYYDPNLKRARRAMLEQSPNYSFHAISLEDNASLQQVFQQHRIDKVLHLAAQAGVRHSLIDPYVYIQTNIVGFHNLIELAKQHNVSNFVYASSASVYGNNKKIPFAVGDTTDAPLSLYGATKKATELIAHAQSIYFWLPTVGLRYFNVYGPWGRPDGAFFIFTKWILEGKTLDVFNNGNTLRNFTYIDDIVDGTLKALEYQTDYAIFNLWNTTSVLLNDMIGHIENACWKTAEKNYLPADLSDIPESGVDIALTKEKLLREPTIHIKEGVEQLVAWYKQFYWY
jgi:UDP-glucuronate 4-epimerase